MFPRNTNAPNPPVLMIFQDGHFFVAPDKDYRVPNVFDNLIYRREMPVTIGVFINPGRNPDQPESTSTNWGDSINNRATEYNELNDRYARMIINELLPALEKELQHFQESRRPRHRRCEQRGDLRVHRRVAAARSIPQGSQHHRQLHQHPRRARVSRDSIRQSERKPIRIFLQDGLNDNRGATPRRRLRSEMGLARTEPT